MRITDITKELDINNPEARRHVSRLSEIELIQRDVEGFYHITPYGETCILLFQEFIFLSSNSEYFKTHTLSKIPTGLVKKIGELTDYKKLNDALDFIRHTEILFKDSKEYVLLLVDKFPVNYLSTIVEIIERGIELKIIEPKERTFNPDIEILTSEETQALSRTRQTPLVEQRMLDEVKMHLILSDNQCVIAFPASDGQFDYLGFTSSSESSLKWCRELFQYHWEISEERGRTPYVRELKRMSLHEEVERTDNIVVVGREIPELDAQAVQDAVDRYDEVILSGSFNLGTSTVVVSKSVIIKGEGRDDDIPLTKVYKSGWTYPFFSQSGTSHQNRVFLVDGEGIDVKIENIHFTDFEYMCIEGRNGYNLTIKNNRITLETGLGRGKTTPTGNQVIGIMQYGGFPGGVQITGNYLDFTRSYGPLARSARANDRSEDPNYRPDLTKHYSYLGFGIDIFYACGKVLIENNVVRNINARGIVAADNTESANIQIKNNTIISEIYGSYYSVPSFAGYGIKATSGWHVGPAPHIEISDNTIRCDKVNYCGIGLTGPELGPEGADKLIDGIVNSNSIHLENGSIGIFTESLDGYQITDNTISGEMYYGIGIFPGIDKKRTELGSFENIIKDNNFENIKIKDPDKYIKILFDDRRYAGSKAGSTTAHVWLNSNTKENTVTVFSNETVIDEGIDNQITKQDE